MKAKVLTMIGFAQKSGNCVSGIEQVLKSIEAGKTQVCFLGNDVAEGTQKKILSKCQHYHVPCYAIFTTTELTHAIGKENRTVVGITNKGFVNSIKTLLKEMGI